MRERGTHLYLVPLLVGKGWNHAVFTAFAIDLEERNGLHHSLQVIPLNKVAEGESRHGNLAQVGLSTVVPCATAAAAVGRCQLQVLCGAQCSAVQ